MRCADGESYTRETQMTSNSPSLHVLRWKHRLVLACCTRTFAGVSVDAPIIVTFFFSFLHQAMYHFLSGYTAKVAGTERGVTEPTPNFSACFGAAFLTLHPTK